MASSIDRADVETDIATQPLEVQYRFPDQRPRPDPYALYRYRSDCMIQRAGRTGHDTGNVFAHFAGNLARHEIRCAKSPLVHRSRARSQCIVGTIPHTQTAPDTGTEKIFLPAMHRAGESPTPARTPPGAYMPTPDSARQHRRPYAAMSDQEPAASRPGWAHCAVDCSCTSQFTSAPASGLDHLDRTFLVVRFFRQRVRCIQREFVDQTTCIKPGHEYQTLRADDCGHGFPPVPSISPRRLTILPPCRASSRASWRPRDA